MTAPDRPVHEQVLALSKNAQKNNPAAVVLARQVQAALALHSSNRGHPAVCSSCDTPYPCATRRALTEEGE